MSNVSIGLAQDLMVDILIRNVRVKITRGGSKAHIDKLHHGIGADILERKWGIGIDKANRNFQSTTQDSVILDLKPLTQRYSNDFLSQRLR